MALNTFLSEVLRRPVPAKHIGLILELPTDQDSGPALQALGDIPQAIPGVSAFNYISLKAPIDSIPALERISVRVHYDVPRAILAAPFTLDPVLGSISISPYLISYTRSEMVSRNLASAPRAILSVPSFLNSRAPSFTKPDIIIVPTSVSRMSLELPSDTSIRHTKVAVLDTGAAFPHPQLNPLTVRPALRTTVPELPLDTLGHGTWCTTCAFGGSANTLYGRVQGVATCFGNNLMHVKVLSTAGFGLTSSILKGIEVAVGWGAKVISMSLGGPLQGSVEEDPECKIIERFRHSVIFVVAAGNSGPGEWTIESPGASPYALTVGAYSLTYDGVSIFSSRGPNAEFYKNHQDIWRRDFEKYGSALIKPDVVAPGGGPVLQGQKADMIYSGCVGWTNGMNDQNPLDLYEAYRGTSMATPHVAGLLALAHERGLARTAHDVTDKLEGVKSNASGYGFITFPKIS